jgi:hypothetical protein
MMVTSLLCLIYSNVLFASYDASELQQLFTDKKQRSQLDAARSGNDTAAEMPQTNQVKVSGYVTRSGGNSVVWLNNKNTLDSSKMGGIHVHQSSVGKNKKVKVTVDGNSVRLKPGETWSEGSGISDIID